jgi:hypothetical protein
MAYLGDDDVKRDYLATVGRDVRALREKADHTCDTVARVLNPETPSRDRISKLERGVSGMDMYDFLRMMWFYRDVAGPDHPAVVLAKLYLPREALASGGGPSAATAERRRRPWPGDRLPAAST